MTSIQRLADRLRHSQVLAIIGSAWGDEGKGKIADFVAAIFDIIARFSGGANAGHTVKLPDGRKVVSHLIPCGLAAGKECTIGRGVLFDPVRFVDEYSKAGELLGSALPPVWIDSQATVWTPWHSIVEAWIETCRVAGGHGGINTTGRGIGPLAAIRALRCDIKVADLLGPPDALERKLELLERALMPMLEAVPVKDGLPTVEQVMTKIHWTASIIGPLATDTSYRLSKAIDRGERVILEGAQATGLDLLWGTNPFVSSGMSTAAGACYGLGLPPTCLRDVLLVGKVLPTRVGDGPFPSEIWNRAEAELFPKQRPELFLRGKEREVFLAAIKEKMEKGQATEQEVAQYDLVLSDPNGELREKFLRETLAAINRRTATLPETSQYFQVLGDERGASTGRGRSVGYFDLPQQRYAQRINGAQYLALTRLDMLSGLERIPVVTNYWLGGRKLAWGEMPATEELGRVQVQTMSMRGWEDNIFGCDDESLLPSAARDLINMIESETRMQVLLVGTGPDRDAMIVR